jgi:hypothetical protein
MGSRAKKSGKATRKPIKGHPAIYTFANVPRDPDREKKVIESIVAKAEPHKTGVVRY